MEMYRKLRKACVVCLLGWTSFAFALTLPESSSTPSPAWATLFSDSATIFYKEGVGIYEGHVRFQDDHSLLTGNKAITHQDKSHQLTALTDYGTPAHYEDQSDKTQPVVADADTIEYYPPKHQVFLKAHASVRQGANLIQGPFIDYNTISRTLFSRSTTSEKIHIALENDGSFKMQTQKH